ncbi:recombinase family protein [Paraburkholderia flagellata]|uniref:recombinase family protein n=1 Tax=Paraburkholderia flagellata TaxID=2883241 RepID=UPI001F3EABA0|nr:recombinase family protein [Paraburkholderia flagellata]
MKSHNVTARRAAQHTAADGQRRLIPYYRYSSKAQEDGDSLRRQADYAKQAAAKYGYMLDEAITDAGVSAFEGKNHKEGALGVFIESIESGDIRPGDTLHVENFDRLSREAPLRARKLIAEILTKGVGILTTQPDQLFTEETMAQNPALGFVVEAACLRAHEESKTKSDRVNKAYRGKCIAWGKGDYLGLVGSPRAYSEAKGRVLNGTDPEWVILVDGKFEFEEPMAGIVREIVRMYIGGLGSLEIAKRLDAAGTPITASSQVNRIGRLLQNEALVGVKVVTVGRRMKDGKVVDPGETFRLEGYYPPLISQQKFDEIRVVAAQRGRRGVKGEIPGVLTGTRIAFCAGCGSVLVTQNVSRRTNGEAVMQRRIRCACQISTGARCSAGGTNSCSSEPIERAVLDYCATEGNLHALFDTGSRADPAMQRLMTKRAEMNENAVKLQRYEAAALEGPLSQVEKNAVVKLETTHARLLAEVRKLERAAAVHASAPRSTPDEWGALYDGVLNLDVDARLKTRALVQQTFERIEVSFTRLEWQGRRYIPVRLVSKANIERQLLIDARTGWWGAVQYDHNEHNVKVLYSADPERRFALKPLPEANAAKAPAKRVRKEPAPA